jgi:PAS domain S-box-containing protein
MDGIRVRSLQWAIGSFFAIIGSLLLIGPHQFSFVSFPLLDQYHYLWAFAFLIVGVYLNGITLFTSQRHVPVFLIHTLAAFLLFTLSYAYSRDGARIGTIIYSVLGLGMLLALRLPRTWSRDLPPATTDLFTALIGLNATLTGILLLLIHFTPLDSPVYTLSPGVILGFGIAFTLTGAWLLIVEIYRYWRSKSGRVNDHPPAWVRYANPWANWSASIVFLAFLLVVSLPARMWIAVAYFLVAAGILTLLSKIESYLERFPPTSLRFRTAVLLTSAAALPLIFTVAWNGNQQEKFMRAEAFDQQKNLAQVIAAQLASQLRAHQTALQVLVAQRGIMDLPVDEKRNRLMILAGAYPEFEAFTLYDATGVSLVSTRNTSDQFSIAGSPDYEAVRSSLQPDIRVVESPALEIPVLRFTAPVLDPEGKLIGLAASEIDISTVSIELNNQGAVTSSQVYLVDESGRVIVHPYSDLITSFQEMAAGPVIRALQAGPDGLAGSVSFFAAGEERLAGYAHVPQTTWGVIIDRPVDEALVGVFNSRDEAFGLLLLSLIAASLVGVFLSRWLTGPLTALSEAVGGLTEGQNTIPLPRTDFIEVQNLVAAFGMLRVRLADRTAERERALSKLRQARNDLEQRVLERTAELRQVNLELEAANRELHSAKWDLEFELAERKELEERLAYQALVLENVHDAVIATDENQLITSWNPGAEFLYGWHADEVIGQRVDEVLTGPESGDGSSASFFIEGGDLHDDVLHHRKDGHPVYVTGNTITLLRPEGGIGGYVATNRDITARRLAEQALQESERRLRTVLEHLPAGVLLADAQGKIVYGNPAASEIWGGARYVGMEEPPKINAWWEDSGELIQPDEWASFRAIRRGETSLKEVIEIECQDGTRKVIHNSAVPIVDGWQEILGAVILNEDITERRKAEVALAESEARERARAAELEALMDTVPAIVLIARDPQCSVITGNRFSYDLLRQPYGSNLSLTPQEAASPRGYRLFYDDVELQGGALPMQLVASTGVEVHESRQKVIFDNGEVRYIFGSVAPLLEDLGEPRGAIGAFADITGLVEAEHAASDYAARLERSNRDLEDFASIASHDLQEPLRKVKAFSDLLQMKYGQQLGTEGCDFLERMRDASDRMKEMIDDLMSYSRVATQPRTFTQVDLDQVARKVIGDLEVSLQQSGGQVLFDDLPVINADPVQMHQLLLNLVANGLKFSRQEDQPVVKVSASIVPGSDIPVDRVSPGSGAMRYLQIRVEDNGVGFEEKFLERIFQPFQRLHGRSQYPGSGIGLAICRKIVEQHSGSITAYSTPGVGSTFIIYLPYD